MKVLLQKYMGVVIAACVIIFTVIVSIVITSTQNDTVARLEASVAALQSQIILRQQTVASNEAKSVQSVTGLNKNRTVKDDEIITDLFRQIFTWSSYDEYNTIRENLSKQYGVSLKGSFMTQFMPEVIDSTDSAGVHYNRIDTFGLNMSYENMESYCTHIRGDVYSYAAFVKISSSDKDGNTGYNRFMVTYDIDVDGMIANLEAFAAD